MNAIERESAALYAASEDASDRIATLTQAIDNSREGVVTVELDDEDSVVHHAEAVRVSARR